MDLVTIITPVYNGEKYLMRYFAQIDAIRYKNLQIIVVNDGSKDKTKGFYNETFIIFQGILSDVS